MKLQDENIVYVQRKIPFIIIGILFFVLLILTRLFYLQVIQGNHYKKLAGEVFIREEELTAKRGKITDRNHILLADTRTYYEIVLIPQYILDPDLVIKDLVKILPLDEADIHKRLSDARFEAKFKPVVIAEDVSYDWVAKLKQHLSNDYSEGSAYILNGVDVHTIPVRQYLYPYEFSHALGYLREIDKDHLKQASEDSPDIYSMGDLTGAAGVEKAYDKELKGQDGQLGRVVDARGREVTGIADLQVLQQGLTVAPLSGKTLQTALDFNAQMVAARLFKDKKGAVVALDPNNGEVLVLYSSPGFDGNRITKKVDKKYWQEINLHEDKILFNRALQAMYPPASTYKVVALSAGIDSGEIDPVNTKFQCGGGISFGNRFFRCWNHGGHGTLTALYGLSQSCDVFFYRLGLKVGVDRLAKYARIFGLGSKTGIEIPFEQSGLVPSTEWKQKRYHEKWYESETLSVAIGQSYNLVTPLQNAVVASMVANGGYRVRPHLGKEILDTHGNVDQEINFPKTETELVGSEALAWVKRGMIEVVHGYGTAKKLKSSPYKIAGKTGTAQVVSAGSKLSGSRKAEAHALFIAFAPYDDPKIAISVVVEHGRGGSLAAAPIAMEIIDTYLDGLYGKNDGSKK